MLLYNRSINSCYPPYITFVTIVIIKLLKQYSSALNDLRTSARKTEFSFFIKWNWCGSQVIILFFLTCPQPRDVDILTTSSTGSVEDLPMSSRNDGFCTPDEEILRMQKLSEEEGYGQLGVSRDELAAKDASKNSETELGSAVVDILKKAKTGPRESEVETEGCEMSFTEVGMHSFSISYSEPIRPVQLPFLAFLFYILL